MNTSNDQSCNAVKASTNGAAFKYNAHDSNELLNDSEVTATTNPTSTAMGQQYPSELFRAMEQHKEFTKHKNFLYIVTVLDQLNSIYQEWILNVSIGKNMNSEYAQWVVGKVCPFGSFRLGIHRNGAKIEALCVAPCHIERNDFITSFIRRLKKTSKDTKCRVIEDSNVPFIKVDFCDYSFHLYFARLPLNTIPSDFNLCDYDILKPLDDQSARTLNKCCVTDVILSLVPNIENFCLAVRSIKLWALVRGIYSEELGYFGDLTWTLMVAKICQMYPDANHSTLVQKFFLEYSSWSWPRAVVLERNDSNGARYPIWNPSIKIPVITPAKEPQNSAVTVTKSSKKLILQELNRGRKITENIAENDIVAWDRLFEAPSFFYSHYVVISTKSQNIEEYLVKRIIRTIVTTLEDCEEINMAIANTKCSGQTSAAWIVGVEFETTANLSVNYTEKIQKIVGNITQHDVHANDISIEAQFIKEDKLEQYLDADVMLGCIFRNVFIKDIQYYRKRQTSKDTFKSLFKKVSSEYRNEGWRFKYTDASKTQELVSHAVVNAIGSLEAIGLLHKDTSAQQAEAKAVLLALEAIKCLKNKFVICTDCEWVINGVLNPKIGNETIKEIRKNIIEMRHRVKLMWVPGHVGIKGNEAADKAAKSALKYKSLHDQDKNKNRFKFADHR